jgi:ATP-dependent helicase Lhr and Lhr-like helicase
MRGVPRGKKPRKPAPKPITPDVADVPMTVEEWFASKGWEPFEFQREAWAAQANGESGLIHASTGTGKTYAAFLGSVSLSRRESEGIEILWLTPLRALSADTALSLAAPLGPLGVNWDVGTRTADTSQSIRKKQQTRLPTVLVTTPESLTLLLTQPDAAEKFRTLQTVVCDEWHELMSSKRGVLAELALARLRTFVPTLRTWGLSATMGNLDEALATLLGPGRTGRIIRGKVPKPIIVDSILPPHIDRFPWAGHLGLTLLKEVVEVIDSCQSALVFTNTRSQVETWYQEILNARPDWAGVMALHHGSLDRKTRDWVEDQLREGTLRCVVCTSTLDLGVDFAPVDRVIQIGSPKGVARLLQRAGRSGHRPGETSRVTCVPTNAFELIESAAARAAASSGKIESRPPVLKPLDVLAQHCVSSAVAGGFKPAELLAEVRTTHAYQHLTDDEWNWTLDFVTRGGEALRAYPEYRRVVIGDDGVYRIFDEKMAKRHRMSIGTISSEALAEVRFVRGGRLGTVEEGFAARLKPGDRFTFAGRTLEFVRLYQMTVQVKMTKKQANTVPRWSGSRMPLSTELSEAVRSKLDDARRGIITDVEIDAVRPVLEVQGRWSRIPAADELLVEQLITRDGFHLFLFPFEGRLVHEGIAGLLAYRLAQLKPQTFTIAINDYGLELVSPDPIEVNENLLRKLLSPVDLADDVLESLNAGELAKRQFREVARVAGLINPGLPNAGRTARQLQASSGLFYDVFREYDPGNLLLWQANREVLDRQFEITRLKTALDRLSRCTVTFTEPPRPTPFAFPLLVERMRDAISSEKLADRVAKLAAELERKAGPA